MEDVKLADETGNYTATWSIIYKLSGKNTRQKVKVKKRDGSTASSEQELLEAWMSYYGSLLNNDNGITPSELPPPAAEDLPINIDSPNSRGDC